MFLLFTISRAHLYITTDTHTHTRTHKRKVHFRKFPLFFDFWCENEIPLLVGSVFFSFIYLRSCVFAKAQIQMNFSSGVHRGNTHRHTTSKGVAKLLLCSSLRWKSSNLLEISTPNSITYNYRPTSTSQHTHTHTESLTELKLS